MQTAHSGVLLPAVTSDTGRGDTCQSPSRRIAVCCSRFWAARGPRVCAAQGPPPAGCARDVAVSLADSCAVDARFHFFGPEAQGRDAGGWPIPGGFRSGWPSHVPGRVGGPRGARLPALLVTSLVAHGERVPVSCSAGHGRAGIVCLFSVGLLLLFLLRVTSPSCSRCQFFVSFWQFVVLKFSRVLSVIFLR